MIGACAPLPLSDWLALAQVRRRLTAHEVDIKDLEAAVRGQGMESPREEIARLRRVEIEPEHYNVDISREVSVGGTHGSD